MSHIIISRRSFFKLLASSMTLPFVFMSKEAEAARGVDSYALGDNTYIHTY